MLETHTRYQCSGEGLEGDLQGLEALFLSLFIPFLSDTHPCLIKAGGLPSSFWVPPIPPMFSGLETPQA